MALVRIVGAWEQDSWLLLLVVALGHLSRRDAIPHRAQESLRLLYSLRLSRSWLHLLPSTQMAILRLQSFNMCIRRQRQRSRSNVGLVILSRHGYTHRIADRGALRVFRQNLLLAPNMSTTTLSNVNPTVCIHRCVDAAGWAVGAHGAAELRIQTLYP